MRFLDKYFAREKELRRLARETWRLRQARRAGPIIPLERSYQRGWVKTYILDERIARRPDAQIFRTILQTVNRKVHSRERSFLSRKGYPIELHPRKIYPREWSKLNWPASHQRFFAFGMWRVDDPEFWHLSDRARRPGYKLINTDWLREEVQPHLITHQRVAMPEVESRLADIEAHMGQTRGWDQYHRLRGRRVAYWRRYDAGRAEEREIVNRDDQLRSQSLSDT